MNDFFPVHLKLKTAALKHIKKSCISETIARKINKDIILPQVKFIVWENIKKMFKAIMKG